MAAKTRLTPAQLDLLRAVKNGEAYRSESIRALYKTFREGMRGPVRDTVVDALSGADLIQIGEQDGFKRPWRITEAGGLALAAAEGK